MQFGFLSTAQAYSCPKMIEKFNRCGVSSQFVFVYKQFCDNGDSLEDSDRRASMNIIDDELAENSCLARIYKPPRFDRKAAAEKRKQDILDKQLRK